MKDEKVSLSEDQKSVLLKSTKDLYFAAQQLHQWVEKGGLTKEMGGILPSLIESHFVDIAKNLDYASHLTKEKEERHAKIRNANQRIRELEEKIGSSKPVDGLKEQLQHMRDTVYQWWGQEGFVHLSEDSFTPYGGFRATFSFMLDHRNGRYSDTPETDKRNRGEHIEHLRNLGFLFHDAAKDRYEKLSLLHVPENVTLLQKLLTERFPSAEIHTVRNHADRNSSEFIIRDFEATIYDLSDI